MNLHLLWSITALTAEIAEVATYLESDNSYSKELAAEQLRTIITNHLSALIDQAMQEGE